MEYKSVTSMGDLKAAALAALRVRADDPGVRFADVEIVNREAEFKIDLERDLLDYWGGMD